MNYYERHIGDYLKDTAHLSLLEHGIYGRLLDIYYTHEKPIQADRVYRLIGCRTDEETTAAREVLNEFFIRDGELWRHTRCDAELAKYADKSQKAKQSARASVEARRITADSTNREIRSARMAAAKLKGTHTDAEWRALREFCGFKCVACGADGHQDRDHILPVYQGGSDSIDNIQPLCARCNSSKGPEAVDHRPNGWRAFVERSLSEGLAPNHQTPDTRHQKNTNPQTPAKRGSAGAPGFDAFWQAYPRKANKGQALKRWAAMAPSADLLDEILQAIARQRTWDQWARDGGKFIPHPASWLNGRRWEDAPPDVRVVPFETDRARAARERFDEMTGGMFRKNEDVIDAEPIARLG